MEEIQSDITITYGSTTDIESIAQFQVDMAKESEGTLLNKTTVLQGVTAAINDTSKGTYIIARAGTEPIGSLMLTKEWSDWNNAWYWWIQSVYVKPEHRRQGVFKSMYQYLANEARKHGVSQIKLYVDKTNLRAQKVYENLGMHESHYLLFET